MIDPKVVNDTKVIFGPCRLSYTHVFEKYSPDGDGEGKFMTNVLIPKSEKTVSYTHLTLPTNSRV